MRKITNKKEKNKKNQIILAGFLVILMFFSVLAYAFNFFTNKIEEKNIEYQGFVFTQIQDYWYLQFEGMEKKFVFFNNPKETDQIEFETNDKVKTLDKYSGEPLYVYSENQLSLESIYYNIAPFAERVSLACLNEENCEGDYPIKTCEDNFIVIKETSNSKIYSEDACIFVEGSKEKLPLITEEFVLKTLDIKE